MRRKQKHPVAKKIKASAEKVEGAGEDVPGNEPDLLTMDQAISLLRTTRPTFYRWLRTGKLKGLKVGRQWRFRREDLERFLAGDEPRIELRADINPFIEMLRRCLAKAGATERNIGPENDTQVACSLMLQLAFATRASDLHLAPHISASGEAERIYLRLRIDGALRTFADADPRLLGPLIAQWKVYSACDPHQRDLPQDGRINFDIGKDSSDARIAFLPASRGETLVVRFVYTGDAAQYLDLEHLGYSPSVKEKLTRALHASWGLIAVSGPTGSGKTSTLYACLNKLASPEIQIVTVEDPIEIQLPWATQVAVKKEMNIASTLRAAMRSDPDVIMVGEQRDKESLVLTQMAAKTGHLVLTCFHSEDAPKTLQQIVLMSGNPLLVADSTKLVLAQRFLRTLCEDCKEKTELPANLMNAGRILAATCNFSWDKISKKIYGPKGCSKCVQSGYKGRSLIAEALVVSPQINAAIQRSATCDEIRLIAQSEGMIPLAADALTLVEGGKTSLSEVLSSFGVPLF